MFRAIQSWSLYFPCASFILNTHHTYIYKHTSIYYTMQHFTQSMHTNFDTNAFFSIKYTVQLIISAHKHSKNKNTSKNDAGYTFFETPSKEA